MSQKKSISKSIRLSPKIYEYIVSQPGNGFNEQFENIILEAMEFENERKENLKMLDEKISNKQTEYVYLTNKIKQLNEFLLVAVRANSMIKELDEMVKYIVSHK